MGLRLFIMPREGTAMAGIRIMSPEELAEQHISPPVKQPRQRVYGQLIDTAKALPLSEGPEEGHVWMAADFEEDEKRIDQAQQHLYQAAQGQGWRFRTIKEGSRLWIKRVPRNGDMAPEEPVSGEVAPAEEPSPEPRRGKRAG